eukprot:g4107.t1
MLDAQPVLESVPSTGRNLERARRQDLEDKIKGEKDWRHKYCLHLDQLVEQTLLLKDSAKLQEVLSKGLEKARAMDFDAGSGPVPLKDALSAAVSSTLGLRPTMRSSPLSRSRALARRVQASCWVPVLNWDPHLRAARSSFCYRKM